MDPTPATLEQIHPASAEKVPSITSFILKVASRCNLNCSYCYVYNKADSTWKNKPPVMSESVFNQTLHRIRRHCLRSGQRSAHIQFHGGEPMLMGCTRFERWCRMARSTLGDIVEVELGIQTNGVLLNESWVEAVKEHEVFVGVTLDGPEEIHNRSRIDFSGKGSYAEVVRSIALLQRCEVPHRVLCVIPLGADPLQVHRHFLSLGCRNVTYILPDCTHDEISAVRECYGPTPYADFLIPIFDDWWLNCTLEQIVIRDLWNVARIIVGGYSEIETFGNKPPRYVFVESSGDIEGLDCLRSCQSGISQTHLNVAESDFDEILRSSTMHRAALFVGMALPTQCVGCSEMDTCAGGYLPHRYSSSSGFNNPSAWCADILKLFGHLRYRLGVTVEETRRLRDERAREAAGRVA